MSLKLGLVSGAYCLVMMSLAGKREAMGSSSQWSQLSDQLERIQEGFSMDYISCSIIFSKTNEEKRKYKKYQQKKFNPRLNCHQKMAKKTQKKNKSFFFKIKILILLLVLLRYRYSIMKINHRHINRPTIIPSKHQSTHIDDHNQMQNMLTRISELQKDILCITTRNQSMEQDNLHLRQAIVELQQSVMSQKIFIEEVEQEIRRQETAQESMEDYQQHLGRLISQVNMLRDIIAQKNQLYTRLSRYHQEAVSKLHQTKIQNNKICFNRNQLILQLQAWRSQQSSRNKNNNEFQSIQEQQDQLSIQFLIQIIKNIQSQIQTKQQHIVNITRQGDQAIINQRNKRIILQQSVRVLKQKNVKLQYKAVVDQSITQVINQMLQRQDNLRQQIMNTIQNKQALMDVFEDRLIQLQRKHRLSRLSRQQRKENLVHQISLFKGKLEGMRYKQAEISMRMSTVVEQSSILQSRCDERDSQLLQRIREVQLENKRLQAQLAQEQRQVQLMRQQMI